MKILTLFTNSFHPKSSRSYCGRVLLKLDSFQFIAAETRHLDAIMTFLSEYHYPQVPTIKSLPNIDYYSLAEKMRDETYNQLKDGLSFIVEERTSGDMVGVGLFHFLHTSLKNHFSMLAEHFKRDNTYYHWKLCQSLYNRLDVSQEFGSPHMIHGRLYSLKPNFQRLGLGSTFLVPSNLIKLPGFKKVGGQRVALCCEANGAHSNKMLERCGYQEIKRLNYTDFEVDRQYPFKSLSENSEHKYITVRVSFLDPEDIKQ